MQSKIKVILLLLVIVFTNNAFAQNNTIYKSQTYSIYQKKVVQNEFTSNILSPTEIRSNYRGNNLQWKQKKDLSEYPQFKSDILISDAMYNLSVEEMTNLIEDNGTWRTGEMWGGVWTRDVSYSILLAMSCMRPDISMNSLMHKVIDGRIMQDTGTGGSYPVSTDCIVWSMAAWQVYLVTGDKEWLKSSYEIIKNSISQDEQIVYDQVTGLVKGESSFLDWRDETYPQWMQPADIYESECLGTNAGHYQANIIAAKMASLLGDKENIKRFENNALRIKNGINEHLWLDDKGYYGQFLYGRQQKIVSPRSETLGEAFCILFDIADEKRSREIVRSVHQTQYGNSCIFPQIPYMAPYHNNGVWPFVQAFWMCASAKAGNETSLMESIAAIYRAASMFATNKENFIAQTGDHETDTNSSNMLWSIAGNISIVHRILFGINFTEDGLIFSPFVPKDLAGNKQLSNFKYRNSTLDIEIKGHGNEIAGFWLDGKKKKEATISAKLKGKHKIVIELKNNTPSENLIKKTENYFSVKTPKLYFDELTRLGWKQIPNAVSYRILKDGVQIAEQEQRRIGESRYRIDVPDMYTEYQIIAVDKNGVPGFASEPLPAYNPKWEQRFDIRNFTNNYAEGYEYMGSKAIEISASVNTQIYMTIKVPETGHYIIDFRYVNGSETTTGGNTCAMRTLLVNKQKAGVIVFPHRGRDTWHEWGFSNSVAINLNKGENDITLLFDKTNLNMNADRINKAFLDYARLIRMK